MNEEREQEVNPAAGEGPAGCEQKTNDGTTSAVWSCFGGWDDDLDIQYPFASTNVIVPADQTEETGDEAGEGDEDEYGY